ncbi:uncharacterized protein LOC135310715 isoform X2 [Phalacrocorax carbo]|uniref:uncharacterized protein LOC135310715 isoform X2 n=1 Tax=Phalacrocorax carbo TaxID=9209 RepID=UPI00311A7C64
MSGAAADRPPLAKRHRLNSPTGTGPVAVIRRETSPSAGGGGAHAREGGGGHARCAGARAPPSGGSETPAAFREGPGTPMAGPGTPKGGPGTPGRVRRSLESHASLGGELKTTSRRKGKVGSAVTRCSERGRVGKGDLETTGEAMGSLETTVTHCLEQGRRRKGDLETTRDTMGSLDTTVICCSEQGRREGSLETTSEAMGSLETTVTHCLEQGRGRKGSPETTGEVMGSLETTVTHCLEQGRGRKGSPETTREVMGSLETTVTRCSERGRKRKGDLETISKLEGSLETTVTHCLEQRKRRKGSPETTSMATGSLESTGEVMGVLETTITHCSEKGRRRKGDLETTSEAAGSLETTIIHCSEQGRRRKGSLEAIETPEGSLETTTVEPEEGLETPIAHLEQGQGGKRVPEPEGGPAPGTWQKGPEECAVISLGEDEEEEEEEEEEEGPGRYLAALEAVQLELDAVEEQAARAFRRLRAKFWLRRRPHLQHRNRLIQHIPGFWVTAFLNHPQLSAMISDRDEDALSYMTSLQVEEFGQTHPGCRIRFFFSVNPYFQNDVVAKEFTCGPSGHLVSHSTPIRWWQGQDPRACPHKGPPAPRSFFAWFGDHSFPAGDRIAEIIKEELWPNPLQFYLLGEGTPESESGEDCVVIVDDDEDVQEIPDDGSGVEEVLSEEPPCPPDRKTDPNGDRD